MSNVDLFSWVRNDQSKDIESLQPGVDVNVVQRGLNPLLVAVQEKKEKCIIALLEKGANPNLKDPEGKTSLHYAITGDLPDKIIKLLIDKGADPNIADSQGLAPIHVCFQSSTKAMLDILSSSTVKINYDLPFEKDTPISLLCKRTQNLLPGIQSGFGVTIRDEDLDNIPQMFEFLLSKGVDVNAVFDIQWERKFIRDISPLGFFIGSLIHLRDWQDNSDFLYQIKVLEDVCYAQAKNLMIFKADIEARYNYDDPRTILEVMVNENLGLLVGHETVQTILNHKWGPPITINSSTTRDILFLPQKLKEKTFLQKIKQHLLSRRMLFAFSFAYYILFLSLFTSVSLFSSSGDSEDLYFFTRSIQQRYAEGTTMNFADIAAEGDVWTWMKGTLIGGVYSDVQDEAHVVVGNITIRQFRQTTRPCEKDIGLDGRLSQNISQCFDKWNSKNEDTTTYGGGLYTYTEPTKGSFGSRSGNSYKRDGGFVIVISASDVNDSIASIDSLIANGYVDRKTAVVIVEFVVYNGNLNILSLVRLSIESLSSGFLYTQQYYNPVRINFFVSNVQIGVEIFFLVVWLGLLFNEIRQMTNGWKIYINDNWNFADICIHTLLMILYGIRIARYVKSRNLDIGQAVSINVFFDSINSEFYSESQIWSLLAILVWFELFKFARVIKSLGVLLRVIRRMVFDVTNFIVLFIIVQVGFGLAFHILLPSLDSFRTWALSMLALFRILIGDLDLNEIMNTPQTTLAVILFVAQVIISTILLLNLLIAMLNQSFMDIIVKATAEYQTEQASIILSYGTQGAKKRAKQEKKLESISTDSVELEKVSSEVSAESADKAPSRKQSKAEEEKEIEEESVVMFNKEGDTNGVIYSLGGSTKVTVIPSSVQRGDKRDFVSKNPTAFLWTNHEQYAFFAVDLGENVSVSPSHYNLRYGSSGNYCCPRNWLMQGSNYPTCTKIDLSINPTEDQRWTTLSIHTNDESLDSDHQLKLFALTNPQKDKFFRYFRIVQVGPTKYKAPEGTQDAWSQVLVVASFELFGKMKQRVRVTKQSEDKNKLKEVKTVFTVDGLGLIDAIGQGQFKVYCSRILQGSIDQFISKGNSHVWTKNEPFSWFAVDMGERRKVKPTHYSMKYASSGNYCCPRNWCLQGSTNLEALNSTCIDAREDPLWTTLSTHVDDATLNSDYASHTWQLDQNKIKDYYRIFRIVQTGPNVHKTNNPSTDPKNDGWSNVLVCGGFDLWGECLSQEAPKNRETIEKENEYKVGGPDIISTIGKEVSVFASAMSQGKAEDFVSRERLSVWTTNAENSWFAVDLGEDRKAALNAYTIRYSSSGNNCCIRNWELQATNNPLLVEDPNIDPKGWTVIDKHTDDPTIDGEFAEHTFPIEKVVSKFRIFRIVQTGKNKIVGNAGWEHVLVCGGFQLFGTLSELVDKNAKKEEKGKEEELKLAKSTDNKGFTGDENVLELLEKIKSEQNEKLKNVRLLMERIVILMQDEISQLEGRLEGKMRGLREEFRKQAKLTLSFKG